VGKLGWLATGVVAVALLAPASARADGPSPQLAFLARFAIDLTVERLTLEDGFLIRMPDADAPAVRGARRLALPAESREVVALLGPGLDVASLSEPDATPVLLQFRPTFARKGGVLRCTFRF
jgi:hypothetical protein